MLLFVVRCNPTVVECVRKIWSEPESFGIVGQRAIEISPLAPRTAAIIEGDGIVGFGPERVGVIRQCSLNITLIDARHTPIFVRHSKIRFQSDGFAVIGDCTIEIAELAKHQASVIECVDITGFKRTASV